MNQDKAAPAHTSQKGVSAHKMAALAYIAGGIAQSLALPLPLFSQTQSVQMPFALFYTSVEPAPPNCRCISGHHDPVLISYKGEILEGWLHSSQTDLGRILNPLHVTPYYIELDMSYNNRSEINGAISSRQPKLSLSSSSGSAIEKAENSYSNGLSPVSLQSESRTVSVMNRQFTVLEPYATDDGRFIMPVVGKPFSVAAVSESDYQKEEFAKWQEWQKHASVLDAKNYGGFLLQSPPKSQIAVYGRLALDVFVVPAAPALLVAGMMARIRRH